MGFDKTAGQQFSTVVSAGIALTTTYQTILQINGPGYIDSFIMNSNGFITTVRITVDGVIKFEGQAGTNARLVGVSKRNGLRSNGADTTATMQNPLNISGSYTPIISGEVFGFPYTLNAVNTGTVSIMADSLYCNSGMLIEAKVSSNSTIPYYVYGGTA